VFIVPCTTKVYPNIKAEFFAVQIEGEKSAKAVKKITYNLRV
jgi:hypothetical protein